MVSSMYSIVPGLGNEQKELFGESYIFIMVEELSVKCCSLVYVI